MLCIRSPLQYYCRVVFVNWQLRCVVLSVVLRVFVAVCATVCFVGSVAVCVFPVVVWLLTVVCRSCYCRFVCPQSPLVAISSSSPAGQ